MSFTEVMFKIVSFFVRLVGEFPRPYVVFEDRLPVEDDKGEVYCLNLSQFCFGVSFVFHQVVDGVEDYVNWLGCVVDCCLDADGIVLKLLQGDASIVVVEELKNVRDEWCNFSGDGVAKGGKIFGVDGLDGLLGEVLFDN